MPKEVGVTALKTHFDGSNQSRRTLQAINEISMPRLTMIALVTKESAPHNKGFRIMPSFSLPRQYFLQLNQESNGFYPFGKG
jgi:1,2-phenylacetyl-CoA epoxidase catalytic subunit